MLTRIISAVIGITVAITVLFLHETIVFPIAVAAVIGIMLFELVRAVKLEKCVPILVSAEICGISLPLIYHQWYGTLLNEKDWYNGFIDAHNIITFCITLLCTFVIFVTWLNKHKEIKYSQIFFVLACMIFVPQAMSTIVLIEEQTDKSSVFFIVMGLCGAWIADSGAYFTGVALGKHKLCPEISPKKTVEGFVGGIVFTAVFFVTAFFVYNRFITKNPLELNAMRYILVAFVGAVCAVIGTVGDLSASMVKRQIGFKDYGKIMPGHGGLMDRFDSVLFVLPTFYVLLKLIGFIEFSW